MNSNSPFEGLLLGGLALMSMPILAIRHPKKTYNLVVHNIGWYG
jgi:hypothetical protein